MKKNIFKNIFIYGFSVVCILPFVIMLMYSFKGYDGSLSLVQYGKALFQREDFYRGFWNTVIYTFVIIGMNIPVSLLGAYGFTRFEFKGKGLLYWLYIVLMMMPFQATIVPQYLTLKALNIIDSPAAVILPNIFSTFSIFLMAQYMRGLNKEIFYAGIIDGLSEFKLFLRMAVPMCKSVIYALIVLLFINYWSMVEQPLIFISNAKYMPMSVTLNSTGVFSDISYAAGTIFSVLPILLYQFFYSDLTKGISLSAGTEKAQTSYSTWNTKEKNHKQKYKIGKAILIFILTMIFLTLLTQKITYIMRPTVKIVHSKKADLKSDPYNKDSNSLGYFNMVISQSCIQSMGSENYVYVVVEEKTNRGRQQVTRVLVNIEASNEIEAAVSGSLSENDKVVKWSTKPIIEGITVNVENQEEQNDK